MCSLCWGLFEFFLPLKNYLPKDIKLISFDPPGHGPNLSPLVDNIDDLVNLYLMEMQPILEERLHYLAIAWEEL